MSNHYHVVLHVNKDMALSWDMPTQYKRWQQLFTLPTLVEHYLQQDSLCSDLPPTFNKYQLVRAAMVNEPIARMANQEDDCIRAFQDH